MNAAVLSVTSLVMQSISLAFGIFISSRVGAEGMGLYSLVMAASGLAVTFATSGIHLATVRLVSEATARDSDRDVRESMKRCIAYALVFGAAAFAIMFSLADTVGTKLLGEPRTVTCLKITAVSMPFIALSTTFSGYFSAVRRVTKSAAVRVADGLLSIGAVAVGLEILLPMGTEYACIAITLGNAFSECMTFILMLVLFLADIKRYGRGGEMQRGLSKKMLGITVPVALTAYFKSGLSTAKNLLIPESLRKYGNDRGTALAQYGMLTGMAMPVITFPQVIISSFSGLMVPEITGAREKKHYNNVRYIITRITGIVTVFSIGAAAALFTFGKDIGMVFYSDASAAKYIRMLSPLVPVLYTDGIVDAALTGLNEQVKSMKINILDSLMSILFVLFLIPRVGAMGWVIMMYFCKSVNALLSLRCLKKSAGFVMPVTDRIIKPLLCAAAAALFTVFVKNVFGIHTVNVPVLTGELIFMSTVYWAALRVTGTVPDEDIKWIKEILKRE